METFCREGAPRSASGRAPSARRGATPAALVGAILAAACGLVEGPGGAAGRARRPVPALTGAIQVNEPDHERWVEAVAAAGLDSVQVTLYARQLAWDSPDLILPDDPTSVVSEIRAAHAAGLRVVLVMRTALEHARPENRHLWHGMIWPGDGQIDAWFDRYREFLLWGARLAEREQVELLAIASELNALTSTVGVQALPDLYAYFLDPDRTGQVRQRLVDCAARVPPEVLAPDLQFRDGTRYESLDAYLRAEERANREWTRVVTGWSSGTADIEAIDRRRKHYERRWRQLIDDTRGAFSGPLTYAANFDQVEEVGFWDALDAIGVNAYYPLSRWGLAGEELSGAMEGSWRGVGERLGAVATDAGGPSSPLPVLFLELGWTTRAGGTVRPFSYDRVEVLETAVDGSDPNAGAPLTCVHWATQPERPQERVRALRALRDVVAAGDFPTLRGVTLWKLTTQASHRAVEPFVVVLPSGPAAARQDDPLDAADRRYLGIAADLARLLARGAPPRSSGRSVAE